MNQNVWSLIGFAAVALIVVGGLAFLSQHYTLDNIKSKTVGDGQYGTARWATKREVQKTYRHVPFRPHRWRKGKQLPKQQGLVLGSVGRKNHVTALVDSDDTLPPDLRSPCEAEMFFLPTPGMYDGQMNER